jgi:hypothetical protein
MISGAFVALCFPLILVALGLYYRHKKDELTHRERIMALEKGVDLPMEPPRRIHAADPSRRHLLYGLIWLFSGIGLSAFLFTLSATMPHRDETPLAEKTAKIEELRKLGASDRELRQVLLFDQYRREPQIPIGIGLAGAVPIGVGLAYLIFYFAERKRGYEPPPSN